MLGHILAVLGLAIVAGMIGFGLALAGINAELDRIRARERRRDRLLRRAMRAVAAMEMANETILDELMLSAVGAAKADAEG